MRLRWQWRHMPMPSASWQPMFPRMRLSVASRNAENQKLSDRVRFVQGDMLAAIEGPIDVVVSNPPYIPSVEIEDLAIEVRREPQIALDGGDDGLDPLRRLLNQSAAKLGEEGVIIVELMPEQMATATNLAVETFGREVEVSTRRDLMGNERALVVRRVANSVDDPDTGTQYERLNFRRSSFR